MGSGRRALAVWFLAFVVLSGMGLPSAEAHQRQVEPTAATAAPVPLADEELSAASLSDEALAVSPEAPASRTVAGVLLLLAPFLLVLRWPATTATVLLALLVLVGGVEGAVHSVHHLDSPQGAASCTVLSVSQQLHGEVAPEQPSGAPAADHRPYLAPASPHDVAPSVQRPDQGRAPPLPLG
jgi:hypothetical protein